MNQRRRKRTVKELFHNRFYNTRFIWWSAEDRARDNMVPVGREFGSPDYVRLMREDAAQLRATLAHLVEICGADMTPLSEASEFRDDAINIQMALKELGHDVSLDTAARVWKHHSNSFLAGWMLGAQSVTSARRGIIGYCTLGSLEAPGPASWKSLLELDAVASDDFKRHNGQL